MLRDRANEVSHLVAANQSFEEFSLIVYFQVLKNENAARMMLDPKLRLLLQ